MQARRTGRPRARIPTSLIGNDPQLGRDTPLQHDWMHDVQSRQNGSESLNLSKRDLHDRAKTVGAAVLQARLFFPMRSFSSLDSSRWEERSTTLSPTTELHWNDKCFTRHVSSSRHGQAPGH